MDGRINNTVGAYKIDDFIGIFDNVITPQECDNIISLYEESERLNLTIARRDTGYTHHSVDNNLVVVNKPNLQKSILFSQQQEYVQKFVEATFRCYMEYAKKYGILETVAKHRFYDDIKIQKTKPSEGYHIWHCENGSRVVGARLLLIMLYLNDVTEGGETEFLYQSLRVQPKKGTLVICPSGFTHTHRGNPPLSGDKYMINGWIEYEE
tara:strand:+ start:105 stop:731 length:627 start_codon:yes stop_codon:yes gene_type:complete